MPTTDHDADQHRMPREVTRRVVLQELRTGAALSAPELVRRTGLARSTVSGLLSQLASEDRIVQQGHGASSPGRPARLWRLKLVTGTVGGVDLGHSHMTVALATPNGDVLAESTVQRDIDRSGRTSMSAAAAALSRLMADHGVDHLEAVAIGVPGPLERRGAGSVRAGGVMSGWAELDPIRLFSRRFTRTDTVVVENDAHLAAIGEHAYGAARGHDTALVVKIGGGVGAGIMIDNHLYRGGHGTSGEIGHIRITGQGPLCRCGSRGCLETVATTGHILQSLQRAHGPSLTVEGVGELLRAADPMAVRVVTDAGDAIGQVLAGTVTALDPEIVVVGSAFAGDTVLTAAIEHSLRRTAHPLVASHVRVVPGELGLRASMLGALARAGRLARVASAA